MAIKHTAVSYYGLNYVEHAVKDFEEMKEHSCDTVILAITEFDMDFWFPNINEIVKACRYAAAGASISVSRPYVLNAIPTRDEIERAMGDK